MSDPMGKRKYAGEPHREARQRDPGPLKLPPHKKPRKYRLTVKYVKTTTETCTKDFHTKDAMREFRGRVEKAIAVESAKPPRRYSHWWGSYVHDIRMESEERSQFREPPAITEELIDE